MLDQDHTRCVQPCGNRPPIGLGLLLDALLFALTPPAAQAAKRVAPVIGNSNYADAPLKNTANDATDIHVQRLRVWLSSGSSS